MYNENRIGTHYTFAGAISPTTYTAAIFCKILEECENLSRPISISQTLSQTNPQNTYKT